MTAAWEVIGSQTLASATASVTFSSIPQGYRDLILVADYSATSAGYTKVFMNLATSSYSSTSMRGNGSTTGAYAVNGDSYLAPSFPLEELDTNKAQLIMNFFDFSLTDKHKSGLFRLNKSTQQVNAGAFRWGQTTALTSIKLEASGTTYASGSTFTLYGSNRA